MSQVRALIPIAFIGLGLSLALATYYVSIDSPFLEPFSQGTAQSLALLLSSVGMDVRSSGILVISDQLSVALAPGCTPAPLLLLYLGAVLGYPSAPSAKIKGALLGIGVLTFLNFIRVTSLFLFGTYYPLLLDVMHVLVTQSLLILAAVGLWLFWVQRYVRKAQF